MSNNIENCRKEIDTIDSEILKLFNRRMEISGEIGKYKEENNLPITDIEREKEILLKAVKKIDGKFSTSARILFSTLMELSKSYQRRNRKNNMDFANSLVTPYVSFSSAQTAADEMQSIAARTIARKKRIRRICHTSMVIPPASATDPLRGLRLHWGVP